MTSPPHGPVPPTAPAPGGRPGAHHAPQPDRATSAPVPADVPGRPSSRRLVGVDIARGLAIMGMFAAHLGADTSDGGADPAWLMIADGRSAALFAFLAGVSLALSTGRRTAPTGQALVGARMKVLYRAGLLLVLGVLLMALGTPVAVILPAYAAMFVLALPFLGADRGWVLLGAATATFVSPVLIFLLTTPLRSGERSVLGELTGLEEPVQLPLDIFATGYYAALIFVAYVLLGLAIGRSRLTSAGFQGCMVAVGAAMAVVAWGSSRLLLDSGVVDGSPYLRRLVSGDPHEYSPVEVLGNCGTSLAVTGLLLLLTRPGTVGRVVSLVLSPVAAAGSMSLTVYSVHIVVIAILGDDVVWYPESNAVLVGFVVVALAVSWAWVRFVGKGPLERFLNTAVRSATNAPPLR